MNLLDCGPEDGGLVVYEGSHLLHEEFFKTHIVPVKDDWYMFSKSNKELEFYASCKKVKPCCNAGDMLIWDSRTVHYASLPTGRKCRSAIYVCMTPAEWAGPEVIKMKRRAFEEKRMTNHWPHDPKLFDANPRTYWNEDAKRGPVSKEMPVLSDVGRKLAGLVPYEDENKE